MAKAKKGLLISNENLLNDIYVINLQVYLDVEVKVESSLKAGLAWLKKCHEDLDVIITLSNMNKTDCGEAIREFMDVETMSLPLVMIGEQSAVANRADVHTLPANLNIKGLLRTLANILDISAKDMSEKKVKELYPIPINVLKNLDMSFCDIYLQVTKANADGEEEFIQVAKKGDFLEERLDSYVAKEIKSLFVPSENRLSLVNIASGNVIKKLENVKGSDPNAMKVLEQGHDLVSLHVSQGGELNPEIVAISKQCVEVMKDVSNHMPKLKTLVASMLSNKVGYLYMHTVLATYVARHILNKIEWGTKDHTEKVQFVLFFHDIYLSPIYNKYPELKYEEDLLFADVLDTSEKEIVISHAAMAAQLVRDFPRIPLGADVLILQHHGSASGEGFAMEFKDNISPLAKVITISEEFVSQLLKEKDKNSAYTIKGLIEYLEAKFTRHSYRKIIGLLKDIEF